jgi:capsid protein
MSDNRILKAWNALIGKDTQEEPSIDTALPEAQEEPAQKTVFQSMMTTGQMHAGYGTSVVTMIYDGEKNYGEMGPVLNYKMDHDKLGQRAWQLFTESETIYSVTRQKSRYKIGTGLNLDCEPKREVLQLLGITLEDKAIEEFNSVVEALWSLYASTPGTADYRNRDTLDKIHLRADRNAELRGDVLVVLRIDELDNVKVQLIDGEHVCTPVHLAPKWPDGKMVDNKVGLDYAAENGNIVRYGVEMNDRGEHVAYHVRTGDGLEWERIPARNRFDQLVAYLYYGEEYRLDHTRGIPRMTASMEGVKQLADYTDATVSSAVERARIPYFIEHDVRAEGLDPRQENMLDIVGGSREKLDLPANSNGEELAKTIAVSTNKQTFNMAPGSKINAPDSHAEVRHKEFHETRFDAIAAGQDMPPEVVAIKFGSSYSASRGSLNLMQFSLNIDRKDTGNQFLQPIYNLQLSLWILRFRVNAPGYIDALRKKNTLVLNAYRYVNWEGTPLPEIDELNAVKAQRAALGTAMDHVPLTTLQKAVKKLGNGNFNANVVQAGKELVHAESQGLVSETDKQAELQQQIAENNKDNADDPNKRDKEEEDKGTE